MIANQALRSQNCTTLKKKFTFKEQIFKVLKAILLVLPNVNLWDVTKK